MFHDEIEALLPVRSEHTHARSLRTKSQNRCRFLNPCGSSFAIFTKSDDGS